MADAAAARREARRKRILENSHNRLQLISGKNNDESCKESRNNSPVPEIYETRIESDSNVHSSYSLLNGVLGPDLEPPQTLLSRHDVVAAGDGEIVNDFAAFGPSPAPEQTQPPLWTTLIAYKYDIVLLSLLLQLIHGLCSINFEDTYFFFPLIIYAVTKQFWYPGHNSSGIANILLLLNGMTPNRIKTILIIVQFSGTLSQDIFVYLFTTICTQSLYTALRDSFVT